jgi:predicted outer membrane protein
MQQFRIRRVFGTAVLALSALALTGCLGDSDPVEFEVTDGDVIGVGIRMTQQHYTLASLAEDESENTDVRALADSIAVHNEAQFAAFDSLDIAGRESNISQLIAQQTVEFRNELLTLVGEDFDQELIDLLVDLHEQNIDLIDDQLLTNVESPELEAEIEALRATLVADLAELVALQAELGTPAT